MTDKETQQLAQKIKSLRFSVAPVVINNDAEDT